MAASATPTGWTVRRRWLPHREGRGVRARFGRTRVRRRRTARSTSTVTERRRDRWWDAIDIGDGCVDADGIVVVLVVVVLILLVAFGPGLVLLGFDLIWLLVVFVGGAFARFVLRRPWSVEAVSTAGERRLWKVRGFGDAARLRDTLRAEFDAGLDPRPEVVGG